MTLPNEKKDDEVKSSILTKLKKESPCNEHIDFPQASVCFNHSNGKSREENVSKDFEGDESIFGPDEQEEFKGYSDSKSPLLREAKQMVRELNCAIDKITLVRNRLSLVHTLGDRNCESYLRAANQAKKLVEKLRGINLLDQGR